MKYRYAQPGGRSRAGAGAAGEVGPVYYRSSRASSQRARLLECLRKNDSINTIEARSWIYILHPPARILDLRQRGFDIATIPDLSQTGDGVVHRVARHFLLVAGGGDA